MKTGKLINSIMIISILFLYACGGGGGGGGTDDGGAPGPESTYTLSGTLTTSGGGVLAGVTLTLSGASSGTITTNPSGNYSFSSLANGTYTVTPSYVGYTFAPISREVTINGANASSISFTATSSGEISELTVEQAQDVLYAAYAGIGYNETADETDDEALYNLMFKDLNSLAGNFINDILWNKLKADPLGEALKLYLSGNTYQYTAPIPAGISSAEIKVDKLTNVKGDFLGLSDFSCDFHAKLTVQFNSSGYTYNSVIYKGSAIDFEAEIDGSVMMKMGAAKEFRPSLNSINISAHKTLSAAYTGYGVQYKEWNISYAAKDDTINIYIVPNIGNLVDPTSYLDVRLYSLNGDFDILKNAVINPYYFDMKYGQVDARQYQFMGLGMYIALDGEVSVPGLNGAKVEISCPGTEILNGNPTELITKMLAGKVNFSDFISRTDDGLWTTGKITMALKNGNTIEAAIKSDGSSTLSPGNISVPAWQDSLDPLLP